MSATSGRPVLFDCGGSRLLGILQPGGSGAGSTGVLVMVGGPQYRVGSHRQFTLMARALADGGFPVLRFDCRGMGDSEGAPRAFDRAGDDLLAAIEAFDREMDGALDGIVLFGLCDAASAILMHGTRHPRVRGLVLANPWVRTERGEARSYVRHYYGRRLLQREFWRKLLAGEVPVLQSVREFLGNLAKSRRSDAPADFVAAMREGLARFAGPVLLVQSGQDLTAREFDDLCESDPAWRALLAGARVEWSRLADADHTFSRRQHLDDVSSRIASWLRRVRPGKGAVPCR